MKIKIEESVLKWIIAQCNIEVTNPKYIDLLNEWKRGKEPTFNQVKQVSDAIRIPFGYFLLKSPPKEDDSLIEYRTVNSMELEYPSRNLIDTIHNMEFIQDWMREELHQEGLDKLPFVGKGKNITDPVLLVKLIREVLQLNKDWFLSCKNSDSAFKYLRKKMSDARVVVMMNGIVETNTHRSLSVSEFRAFALVDEFAPLIFINSNDSLNGKIFSLIHEFAHIVIGENSLYNENFGGNTTVKRIEVLCNKVSAELLVPTDLFRTAWESEKYDTENKIQKLASYFKCGTIVVARKALDLKKITKAEYDSIVEEAIKNYEERNTSKQPSGGNYYNNMRSRLDEHFLNNVIMSVQAGRTLYSEAFRLTNTTRKTFDSLTARIGGELY